MPKHDCPALATGMLRLCICAIFLAMGSSIAAAQPRIIINEIMYGPKAPEPEWVEIQNLDSVSQNITGWKLLNHSKSATIPPANIPSGSFLVLAKDSVALRALRPGSYAIMQIAMPVLVNTGDVVSLLDSNGRFVDSIRYLASWGGGSYKSLERINPFSSGNIARNWQTSKDSSGATPGAPNSVRLRGHDIALILAQHVEDSAGVTFNMRIANRGSFVADSVAISVVDGIDSTLLTQSFGLNLPPDDTATISIRWISLPFGWKRMRAIAILVGDEVHSNDSLSLSFLYSIPTDSLLINEIMYQPQQGSGQWIELINMSTREITLDSTMLGLHHLPTNGKPTHSSLPPVTIAPKGYALIADKRFLTGSFFDLNLRQEVGILDKSDLGMHLGGDTLVLMNQDSSIIAAAAYAPTWHHAWLKDPTGISLERRNFVASAFDSTNWHSCGASNGGTPLHANSTGGQTPPDTAKITTLTAMPNPFSPDGDGFEDVTSIQLRVADAASGTATAKLFDARGRLVRMITDHQQFTGELDLLFDGHDQDGRILRPGLYTLIISWDSGGTTTSKRSIGIAIAPPRH